MGLEPSSLAKIRVELKTALEKLSILETDNAKLEARLAGETALRVAMLSEATAKAKESMIGEVTAAFKDGLSTARSFMQDASSIMSPTPTPRSWQ